jgi:hypothetical protein
MTASSSAEASDDGRPARPDAPLFLSFFSPGSPIQRRMPAMRHFAMCVGFRQMGAPSPSSNIRRPHKFAVGPIVV